MSHAGEKTVALNMSGGRLLSRFGVDRFLYRFVLKRIPAPEPGRPGFFLVGERKFPARVVDGFGAEADVLLISPEEPPNPLSGRWLSEETAPDSPPGQPPVLPGASSFLDSQDGWVIRLTEAADRKHSSYLAEYWPEVGLADLPDTLSAGGLTFVWRQKPSPATDLHGYLTNPFLAQGGRILVLASRARDLIPWAGAPGALFLGPALAASPLGRISIYTRLEEHRRAQEEERQELRRRLSEVERTQAGLKAGLSQWEDLAALERRFAALEQDAERRRREWRKARQRVDEAQSAWSDVVVNLSRKSAGWFRRGRRDHLKVQEENARRLALEGAEKTMARVRREEEELLREAAALSEQVEKIRRESQIWLSFEALQSALEDSRRQVESLNARLNAPIPEPDPLECVSRAFLILAQPADLRPDGLLAEEMFDVVLALPAVPPDQAGRSYWASLAQRARRHFLLLADFSLWPPWGGPAPTLPDGRSAWKNVVLAEEADPRTIAWAQGEMFGLEREGGLSSSGLYYGRLELGWPEAGPETRPNGLGLRVLGELGPVNPASALIVARAARSYALKHENAGPAVYILTASSSQAALVQAMLEDIKSPPGKVLAGEPSDFDNWPPAPLVILEPAFEAPHLSHPWAWPGYGRHRLLWAWHLAQDGLLLAGRDDWISKLSPASPLAALWRKFKSAESGLEGGGGLSGEQTAGLLNLQLLEGPFGQAPPFWEALDKAKKEVWALVPSFHSSWWKSLEGHFLAALRRKVEVTLLSAVPDEPADRDYAGQAIKTLNLYGASVHLTQGLPGFMAVVDSEHFTWGNLARGWGGLQSLWLPKAAPLISGFIQLPLIRAKLGTRQSGLRACPLCGWPLVLINQEQPRGFGDDQALKLGCFNQACLRAPRRLDERWPFTRPPVCGRDPNTVYRRQTKNKQEYWICPNHPHGPGCPSYRVIPGDVK